MTKSFYFLIHPQNERERPVSAQSGDFVDGFRAGVRAKQEKERELHRESISESENVLRRGLYMAFVVVYNIGLKRIMFNIL